MPNVEAGCNRNVKSRMFATGVPLHLVIANSVVGIQRGLDEFRLDVITKLDHLPEALKQCMLQNFHVDGTIPITHVQVVDMLTDLKSSLETSFVSAIRRDRKLHPAAPVTSTAVDTIGGHASATENRTWSWKGRFYPVAQDFRFPK